VSIGYDEMGDNGTELLNIEKVFANVSKKYRYCTFIDTSNKALFTIKKDELETLINQLK